MKKYRSKKTGQNIIRTYDKLLSQWDVHFEEFDIETRYGMTHIIKTGNTQGKPVLLLHGVGDDSALMWIYNAKELGKAYCLYAIDTIGGPGKSNPNENYNKSYEEELWFDDVLSSLHLEQVSIIGVSHGGYVAQYLQSKRADKVEKSISMAGAVAYTKEGEKRNSMMSTMIKIFLPEALLPTKKNTLKLLKKLAGERYQVFTENADILEHYSYLLRGFNTTAMGYHKVKSLSEEEINKIRSKVYYLVGEEDPFEKMGGKDKIIQCNMNAKFYQRVGHGINHEIANEINPMLISILDNTYIDIRNY